MDKGQLNSSASRAGAHTGSAIHGLLGANHGLTSIEDVDLIRISSPGSNGTRSAPSQNQFATPDHTDRTKSIMKTDGARGRVQHQLQLSSATQLLSELDSHLAVRGNKSTPLTSQTPPSFEYSSASHLLFQDRPQLYNWLKETSNSRITVTERLEKLNWESYEPPTPPIAAADCLLRELDILASL